MRVLLWDGLRNVRDLGGLPTPLATHGRTVFGRVARGPRRELLTAAGWEAAGRWGVRSIVDLRCGYEAGRRDGDPDAQTPTHLAVVSTPTEDHDNAAFREHCFPILDSPEYWQHNVRILPALIRNALGAIADADPGVYVHCSAGRDRTGMVTALLLANAGVGEEDIVADYAASVRAMAGTAGNGGPTHDRQEAWSPQQVDDWLASVTPHVRAFVAEAHTVMTAIGLDAHRRKTLRALLTEEPARD